MSMPHSIIVTNDYKLEQPEKARRDYGRFSDFRGKAECLCRQ